MSLTEIQGSSVLKKLGLSDVEIVVYNKLLEQAEYISIRKLADESKLNRGVVYEALKNLVNLNLVSYNQKGERRRYFAERPTKIYDLLKSRKEDLLKAEIGARSLVPRLQAMLKRQAGQPQVRFYEYDEGMHSILTDVLNTVSQLPEKVYHVYSHQDIRPYLYRQYQGFTNKRLRMGIEVFVIKVGKGEILVPADKVKRLQTIDAHQAKCYQIIYGNKVAMISVSSDGTPYGVVFEEAGVAKMHRILFDQVWNSLKDNYS